MKKTKGNPKPSQTEQRAVRSNQLLGFTRSSKKNKQLVLLLDSLDQELQAAYHLVRQLQTGHPSEEEALEAIREMENRRFELLSEIHGNRVQSYRRAEA